MRFRRQNSGHMIDFLFVLSLFCVFTMTAFIVVIIGANVYQSTVDHMENTYSTRTALSYVTEKIRQHDEAGMVSLTELEGNPALMLRDTAGETSYITYIYSDGSRLLEFTVSEGTSVSSGMGKEIIRVKDFSITEEENGFLRLSAKDTDGHVASMYLHLRNSTGYSDVASE